MRPKIPRTYNNFQQDFVYERPSSQLKPLAHHSQSEWTKAEDEKLESLIEDIEGEVDWKEVASNFEGRKEADCMARWKEINVDNPSLIKWKKKSWTEEQDIFLIKLIEKYGPQKWTFIAEHLPGRIGKQCRERWHNHLNPSIKKEQWSDHEQWLLYLSHRVLGNRWAEIAKYLTGRTDNSIKNHWNSSMKKRLSELYERYKTIKKNFDNKNQAIISKLTSTEKQLLQKMNKCIDDEEDLKEIESRKPRRHSFHNQTYRKQFNTTLITEKPRPLITVHQDTIKADPIHQTRLQTTHMASMSIQKHYSPDTKPASSFSRQLKHSSPVPLPQIKVIAPKQQPCENRKIWQHVANKTSLNSSLFKHVPTEKAEEENRLEKANQIIIDALPVESTTMKSKKKKSKHPHDKTIKKNAERFDIMLTPKKQDKSINNIMVSPFMMSDVKVQENHWQISLENGQHQAEEVTFIPSGYPGYGSHVQHQILFESPSHLLNLRTPQKPRNMRNMVLLSHNLFQNVE